MKIATLQLYPSLPPGSFEDPKSRGGEGREKEVEPVLCCSHQTLSLAQLPSQRLSNLEKLQPCKKTKKKTKKTKA